MKNNEKAKTLTSLRKHSFTLCLGVTITSTRLDTEAFFHCVTAASESGVKSVYTRQKDRQAEDINQKLV